MYLAIAIFNTDDGPFTISDHFCDSDRDVALAELCQQAELTEDDLYSLLLVHTNKNGDPAICSSC